MKFIFSAFFSLCVFFAFAQSGNFFLSHYSPSEDRLDNICFQVRQGKNGVMYFATRSGILEFDGKSWNLLNGNGAVYTIQITEEGRIFWGGARGFGVVTSNESNFPQLNVLSDQASDIFQSLLLNRKIFFLNEEKLYILDVETEQSTIIDATIATGSFIGLFEVSGEIFLNTSSDGIYKVSESKLLKPVGSIASLSSIVFTSGFKGQTLAATINNEIFVASDNKTFRKVTVEDQQYLNEGVITSGSWVNDDLVVLGTLRGGMIFLNLTNGKTHEIINYATGLPDNEIFTVVTDENQCVWAAHEYGFTRVAPYLPFRTFSHYPGLEGNLLCAVSFRNTVYVGTSVGMYKLEQDDVFEERKIYSNVATRNRVNAITEKKEPTPNTVAPEASKRRGFFRWFRKKNSTVEETKTEPSNVKTTESKSKPRSKPKVVVKTEKVLVSSSYRYKKVKNIDAKIIQFHSLGDKLVACGLGGTYEVDDLTGTLLLADPARRIYGSKNHALFISTYSDKVKTLYYNGSTWVKTDLLKNLNDQVNHIFEGHDGIVWLCALDKIYRLQTQANEIAELKVIKIENPNYDEFAGAEIGDKVILANSNGLYEFNPVSEAFQKLDSTRDEKFLTYFSANKSIWYRDIHGWTVLGDEKMNKNLALLNLFQNIRFINPDSKTENLWVITNSNELYKYFSDRINMYTKGFPLVLKTVKNGDRRLAGDKRLKIEQDNSRLTFEVVQPDYLASEALEYRYHLTGLEQDWTDWSQANNVIEIPYLPAGDYSLNVESRDIFGKVSSMEIIALDVRPPYWKTPWFYALEVVLFTLFVILSFRLSTRYRIISRLLMLLTIIMLIQFVETIIGETLITKTSPVIDFMIQVVIAMLILPIEGYLRELMLRSLDTNHRFYRFIAPKAQAPRDTENV
jgi:hypothetical protein